MIDVKLMATFATVAELASFEKAAKQLSVTQSAISQRVKLLEDKLGHLLLVRTTPIKVTKQGMKVLRYYQQLSVMNTQFEQTFGLQGDKHDQDERLRIKIGINADSLDTWFVPVMDELLSNEKYLWEFIVQDQSLTHKMLRDGQVMASISEESSTIAGCNTRYVGDLHYGLFCSKAFYHQYFSQLNKYITNGQIDEIVSVIQAAPAVFYNRDDGLYQQYLIALFASLFDSTNNESVSDMGKGAHQSKFDIAERANSIANEINDNVEPHYIPSVQSYYNFIRQGHGCGIVPIPQWQESQDDCVVNVFPNIVFSTKLYWHYWTMNRSTMEGIYQYMLKGIQPSYQV